MQHHILWKEVLLRISGITTPSNAGRRGRLLAVITASNSDLIVCDVDLNYTQMASGTPTILCLYSVVGHLLFKGLLWSGLHSVSVFH